MANRSAANDNLTGENTHASRRSLSEIKKYARQDGYISMESKTSPAARSKPRLVIHTTVRPTNSNKRPAHRQVANPTARLQVVRTKLVARYHSDMAINANPIRDFYEDRHSPPSSVSTNLIQTRQRSRSQPLPHPLHVNDRSNYAPRSHDHSTKTIHTNISHGDSPDRRLVKGDTLRLDISRFVDNDRNSVINMSSTLKNDDRVSNTKVFHRDPKNNAGKKKNINRYPCVLCCSCPCLLLSLLATLLMGIVLTTILVAVLIKSYTTTTKSVTFTTTTSTTTTPTVCSVSNSTDLYLTSTTNSYTFVTYNYTASSTGPVILEFGFKGQTGSDYWHLDDVSLIDTSMSNSEILINGNFENGTLAGWQVSCTSNCQSPSPFGVLSTTSCQSGVHCYEDACKLGFDFLQQTLSLTMGHIYTLSFWLQGDSKPQQGAFVRFF